MPVHAAVLSDRALLGTAWHAVVAMQTDGEELCCICIAVAVVITECIVLLALGTG